MLLSDVIYSFFLTSQISVGVLANSLVFLIYAYIFLIEPHLKKPMDVMCMHLTLVNTVTIVFQSTPQLVSSFGVKDFLDDIGCKTFLYISRVTRGLSICTTSLLSVFQAITVSPSHSRWAWLKSQLSQWILPSLLSFWVIDMLICIYILEAVRARLNFSVVGLRYVHAYCESRPLEEYVPILVLYVLMIHDLVCMVPMVGSSLYMVLILYRHRRRARHIHSLTHSSQSSAENKATRTILLLVLCFVVFYFANNLLMIYGLYASEQNARLEGINGILSSSYRTFCPFLLIRNNKVFLRLTSCFSKMRVIFSRRAYNG
ncbi:olfactory receptor class A-like protein 1 [Ochotona curzoniae]|uniref:olfactory receptor class A-like protein 1 n=1 Tax=Ochotona curzoniae TaxID=130825 RepID=UPI001B349179|nr:olfactory receptor class A-like protein 1 [Ochotona curzoniae]